MADKLPLLIFPQPKPVTPPRGKGFSRQSPQTPTHSRQVERLGSKIQGANYYPDFIVKKSAKEVFIVETKGLEDLDVPPKMARLRQWCEDINRVQPDLAYDFVFVDEESFNKFSPRSFAELAANFRQYKFG